MVKKFVDNASGQSLVDCTAEEEAQITQDASDFAALETALSNAATKKATDTASAKTKLKGLGLTDDELEAILGI
tara:strand:- start:222 stop:443 length:222 start_codon:yes stop_codon:yes gene_type:complete